MSSYLQLHRKHFDLQHFVTLALKEDIQDGDHTALATLPKKRKGKMELKIKEDGVLAGVEAAKKIYAIIDPKISFKKIINDGESVKKGQIAFRVSGNTRTLLSTERLILNIMQRMSGIATKTKMLQNLCTGTSTRVIDTRKTTPNFRFFEKWAVVCGGGANHRFGLYDMILIKDNHIDFCGGITNAIDSVNKYLNKKNLKLKIEIEARSIADVKEILKHGKVHRIMLDNFTPVQTKTAVQLINKRFETESSGGITEKNIRNYALCGVDFISIGALTHHVKSLDLSLKTISR
ncbi:MAG: carboxylating nicotinate-nucleotide diphosphorylase [Sphingobacteriaceae bacterium]|nr:carboxylating nicotinate-nucleotide diphosphorylase [Sphingobacteriaceae bacterium]